MGRKSDGEKIDELEKLVATLVERLDNVHNELQGIREDQDKTVEVLNNLKTNFAVIDERLGELKKGVEEAGRRRWAIVPSVIGATIGAVLGSALTLVGQMLLKK